MAHPSPHAPGRIPPGPALRTYARIWLCGWGLVVTAGLGLAAILWKPNEVLGLFLPMAFATGAATVCYLSDPDHPPAPTRSLIAAVARNGAVAGLVVVAAAAGLHTSAGLAGGLLGLAALTSPWTLRLASGYLSRPNAAATDTAAPGSDHGDLTERELTQIAGLTDGELCRQWRDSFARLLDARHQSARMRIVRMRQAYLDELESRHPRAVSAWLASNPRAASGPEQYLRRDHTSRRDSTGAA